MLLISNVLTHQPFLVVGVRVPFHLHFLTLTSLSTCHVAAVWAMFAHHFVTFSNKKLFIKNNVFDTSNATDVVFAVVYTISCIYPEFLTRLFSCHRILIKKFWCFTLYLTCFSISRVSFSTRSLAFWSFQTHFQAYQFSNHFFPS